MHQSHRSCQPDDEENKLDTGGVASRKFTHSFGIHQQNISSLYFDIVNQELAAICVCAPHEPVAWVMPAQWWGNKLKNRRSGLLKIYTQLWNAETKYRQSLHWFCGAKTCWDTCLCAKNLQLVPSEGFNIIKTRNPVWIFSDRKPCLAWRWVISSWRLSICMTTPIWFLIHKYADYVLSSSIIVIPENDGGGLQSTPEDL